MDPDATLREIRKLCKSVNERAWTEVDIIELVELVEALDNWIVNGGFFPEAWSNLSIETRKILAGKQHHDRTS